MTSAKQKLQEIISKRKKKPDTLESIPVLTNRSSVRLSFGQERLWFLNEFMGPSAVYNIPMAVGLEGNVDERALVRSLKEIHNRHQSLRTRFENRDGIPIQVIEPVKSFDLEIQTIKSDTELARIAYAEKMYMFDLTKETLCRIRLLQTESNDNYTLLVTMHHSISDAWSINILFHELITLYQAFLNGENSPLPVLDVQYLDFSEWQRSRFHSDALEPCLAYWRAQLSGLPAHLDLPTDRPRPKQQTFKGSTQSISITSDITKELRLLARDNDVTLYMLLLTVFAMLLSRYSGQKDLAVGLPIANRTEKESEKLIGFFANTIVMRADTKGDPTFRELLSKMRKTVLDGFENQHIPFEKIVEDLKLDRNLQYSPLFQIMFSLQNNPVNDFVESDLKITPLDLYSNDADPSEGVSRFDLTLNLQETDKSIAGSMEYNTDLFNRETISKMVFHFNKLLKLVIEAPNKKISFFDFLDDKEKHQQIHEWNQTEREYSSNITIIEMFEFQNSIAPEAIAITYDNCSVSYLELDRRANQLSRHLISTGVKVETPVAICFNRSIEMVVAILGILKAGAYYVPLDPEYPTSKIVSLLKDSQASVMLFGKVKQGNSISDIAVESHSNTDLTKLNCIQLNSGSKIWQLEDTKPEVKCESANLAYLIYTSGSTGKPKGVGIPHQALVNRIEWMRTKYEFSASEKVLQKTPYNFDVSVWEIFLPLVTGAELVVARPSAHKDPAYLANITKLRKISYLHFVPSMLNAFILANNWQNCESVKWVICSGEALSKDLEKRFFEMSIDSQLENLYGPTEAAIDVTSWSCQKKSELNCVPIGVPIQNIRLYVLDESLRLNKIGAVGELYIGGVGLARGYLNQPALSSKSFIPDPFSKEQGQRMYATGDLVRYKACGSIEYVGRKDRQIKLRGFRIELGEIESVFLKHERVTAVTAMVFENDLGEFNLVAYIVDGAKGQSSSSKALKVPQETGLIEQIRSYVEKQLPKHMVPAFIVEIESIPLSANGKVDREALPLDFQSTSQVCYEEPTGKTEELLASLWSDVLGLNKISRNDNFFRLGGHSLLATQLISRIRESFNIEIEITSLFEHQTIEAQANSIDQKIRSSDAQNELSFEKITPVINSESFWLSHSQLRLWFLNQYMGPNAVYNIPLALRLNGKVNEKNMVSSLEMIFSRHDSLRTRFVAQGDSAIQVVDTEALNLQVERVESEKDLKAICMSERGYKFDLSTDRLCRIRLVRDFSKEAYQKSNYENQSKGESYVLLVTMHHGISDGWSMGVFFKELVTYYNAFNNHSTDPIDNQNLQYVDYAAWQRKWLEGDAYIKQVVFWKSYLRGLPPLLNLPTDKPRPNEQTYRGSIESLELTKKLTRQLNDLSKSQGVTLFMTLISAFSVLLNRYTDQDDLAIGTPIANRNRKETENIIGFFVNTLVMRFKIESDTDFISLLEQTRADAVKSYNNQDVPFEQLVEELNPVRNPSYSPLFQVMFALQNMPKSAVSNDEFNIQPLEFDKQSKSKVEHSAEGVSRYDLTLIFEETSNKLVGGIEYNTDLFSSETIRGMLNNFEGLLQEIVDAPKTKISCLQFGSKSPKALPFIELHKEKDVDNGCCAHRLFEENVESNPNAVALLVNDREITYRELNERVNQYTHYFIKNGFHDKPIGIYLSNNLNLMLVTLAVLKTGSHFVYLDSSLPTMRLAYLVELYELGTLIVDSNASLMSEKLSGSAIEGSYSVFEIEGWDNDKVSDYPTINLSTSTSPEQLAAVSFEGGCHGLPQTQGISHKCFSMLLKQTSGTRKTADSILLRELFDERSAETFSLLARVVRGETNTNVKKMEIDNFEVMNREVFVSAEETISQALVLDSNGIEVPVGIVGDLYLDAGSMLNQTLDSITTTDRKFRNDKISSRSNKRIYFVGHRACRLDSTMVEIVSQYSSDMIHTKAKFDLTMLSNYLDNHKHIRQSVFKRASYSNWVDDLTCYAVLEKNVSEEKKKLLPEQLNRFIRAKKSVVIIPTYFVFLERLPQTTGGQIDKNALPEGPSNLLTETEYVAPLTKTQTILAEIWQRKLSIERVGIEDNYFVLGGDSIRSIGLVAEAKENGLSFSIKNLFSCPTIKALSELIDSGTLTSAEESNGIKPFQLLTKAEIESLSSSYSMEEIQDAFPLSLMQEGMVLLAMKHSNLNVYENIQVYHFQDEWDESLFNETLVYLMNRHPMMKTVYHLSADRPVQLIIKNKKPLIRVNDLRKSKEADIKQKLKAWIDSEKQSGIDTSQSLWRTTIHLLPDNQFLFGMFIHHALWDGWSLESFTAEVYSIYAQLRNGERLASHNELPSYNQFIAQEQQAISSLNQREYWKSKLVGANLPWWTGQEKSTSISITCPVSVILSSKLINISRSLGVQEKSLWCVVYLTLLSLLDGNDDIVGPVITQGRPEIPGGDQMVGVFLNVLPLRASVTNISWAQLIRDIDEELREQHGYRHYPLAEIQGATGLDLSAVLFTYTNWHVYHKNSTSDVGSQDLKQNKSHSQIPKKISAFQATNYLMDVYVNKNEQNNTFAMSIHADQDVFGEDVRSRITDYVSNIIDQLVTNVFADVDKSKLLSLQEREKLLTSWNSTTKLYPKNKCIHQLFELQVENNPNAKAVIFEGDVVSYGELNSRANQVANYLITNGTLVESKVGICAERSIEMIVGMLAILKAGACYVPLDPEYPSARLELMLKQSDCHIILSERHLMEELPLLSSIKSLPLDLDYHQVIFGSFPKTNICERQTNLCSENLAYEIYTSGSSGQPKGVQVNHRAVINYLCYAEKNYFPKQAGSVVSTSFNFDATVTSLLAPLVSGRHVQLLSNDRDIIDSLRKVLFESEQGLTFKVTPVHLELIKQNLDKGVTSNTPHELIVGGEQLNRDLLSTWLNELLPQSTFVNEYGPTETVVGCSTATFDRNSDISKDSNVIPIGKPISNTDLYVVDADLNLLPTGVSGELLIGGAGVARGYIERPGHTAKRFIPHLFTEVAGQRLYRSGDLVRYLPSGELEFLGRVDNQVKIRGYRIELGEIECLIRGHQKVKDGVVIARDDISEGISLVCYFVPTEERQDSALEMEMSNGEYEQILVNELRTLAQQQLPAYMVPVAYVPMKSLPLTINGKVDRASLPKPDISSMKNEYISPRNDLEEKLCEYWASLLKVEQVGVLDNFWDLGGQSLLALRLTNILRQELGLEIPLKKLFEYQNIMDLAEFLQIELDALGLSQNRFISSESEEEMEEGCI